MKKFRSCTAVAWFLVIFSSQLSDAHSAEVKVLCAAGIKSVVEEIGPRFEQATGHKLKVTFVGGPAVRQAISNGEAYDVAISQPSEIDNLINAGKIVLGSRAHIARSGMGMGVRQGANKPNIANSESFKTALLNFKSITYAGDGASGAFFNGLFEKLGIAADLKPKLKSMPAGTPSAEAVARGEAEAVLLSVPSILAVSGVELVGPLPPELQYYSGFAGGIVAGTGEVQAAAAFITFLTAESILPVLKAKGLDGPAK